MKILVLSALAVALAAAGKADATVYFDFHRVGNTTSVLYETWQDATSGKVYAQHSWRAGSGTTTNECQVGYGWLPGGYYNIVAHYDHFDGTKIKGRVWQLNDKACWNGTTRSELFIHSEETAANGQACSAAYDDPFCWEGAYDYYSLGCIKLSRAAPAPTDLARADNDWHNWGGGAGTLNLYHRVYVY